MLDISRHRWPRLGTRTGAWTGPRR
jgi:hypothetical protein